MPDAKPDKAAEQPAAEQQPAAAEPFDPATEEAPAKVEPPALPTAGDLMRDAEAERLHADLANANARIEALQRELAPAELVPYEDQRAATGHLEERLARVTAAMSRIPKRGTNTQQNYAFVTHSDVLDSVRPALAAEGVAFRAEMKAVAQAQEDRQTSSGMPWFMWRIDMEFRFACWAADVREQETIFWSGWAQDYSDKGASKAMTAAIKTFLIQQFLISTGDDPDETPSDTSSSSTRPAQQRQQREGRPPAVAPNVQQARKDALEWNKKLPRGVLSQITKKIAGQGVIIKVEDVAQLAKIAAAAERYAANPEGGQAWLDGKTQEQSGEPEQTDADRQDAAEAGDVQPGAGSDALPYEPVTPQLPPADSYDPPLNEDELRQHALGIIPRTEGGLDDA